MSSDGRRTPDLVVFLDQDASSQQRAAVSSALKAEAGVEWIGSFAEFTTKHPDGEKIPIFLHHARDGKHHVSTPLSYPELAALDAPDVWTTDPRDNIECIEHEVFASAPDDLLDAIPQEDVRTWVDDNPLRVGTLFTDGDRILDVTIDDVDEWAVADESAVVTDGSGIVVERAFEEALEDLAADVHNLADTIETVLRDYQQGQLSREDARRRVAEHLEVGVDPREVLQEGGG